MLCRSRARVNGNTTTFRRASGVNILSQQPDVSAPTNRQSISGSVYVPPHINASNASSFARNGYANDARYSKDQLLDLFKLQERTNLPNIEDLFVDGWDPKSSNGTARGSWNSSEDRKDIQGPEICWDYEGGVQPIGLQAMTEDEREVQTSSYAVATS